MSLVKTPVSILQELLQKSNQIPQYASMPPDGLGTHNPTFRFRVIAGKVIGFGKARSKKEAKHEAAKDALAKFTDLGLYIPDQSPTSPLQTSPVRQEHETPEFQINAVGMLKEYVTEYNLPPPTFKIISGVGPSHQRLFTLQCTVGTLKKTASEYTKKKAKHACALLMYQCLLESLPDITDSKDIDFICIDEKPSLDNILQEYSDKTIKSKTRTENYKFKVTEYTKNFNNYKLKIAEYPKTFNNIMKEKNLSFAELWQDIHSATEENLEIILNRLDLKFSLEVYNNQNNFIFFLSIDSEPNFSSYKIAKSRDKAMPHLIQETFKFLKIMTS